MTSEATEARLVKLESLVAQNQKTIEELNEVVVDQGQQLDRLKGEIEVLGREILLQTEGEAGPHIKAG
ncbi:MAG: SlyX family protein [Kiloniellales bacterium]